MKSGYHTGKLVFGRTETIGRRIKKARRWYGMSQEELGVLSGAGTGTIGRIEAGDDFMVSTLARIAIGLDVPLDRLVANLPELRR